METIKGSTKILKTLLSDLTTEPTVTYLAKETGMSRVGTWKLLKKMQADEIIRLLKIGTGKTSMYGMSLNWSNPVTGKKLALALTEDAQKHKRWANNFAELEDKVEFLIVYGSILRTPREANDIDLLGIVSDTSKFVEIEKSIGRIQKTQLKKIHALNFTRAEFKQELEKPNEAFVDAINKGVVLFGQENFIKFIKGVNRK